MGVRPDAASAPWSSSHAAAASELASGAGPSAEPQVPTSRIAVAQQKVDETKEIMFANIQLVNERGEKIEDLDGKAAALNIASNTFKTRATNAKKKMVWQKWKWRLCCLVLLLILCSGIITTLVLVLKR